MSYQRYVHYSKSRGVVNSSWLFIVRHCEEPRPWAGRRGNPVRMCTYSRLPRPVRGPRNDKSKTMKRISTITGIVIIVAVAVIATGGVFLFLQKSQTPMTNVQSAITKTSNWKKYTNNEGKFSLQYPSGWTLTADQLGVYFEGSEGSIEIRYKGIYGFESCEGYTKFELNGEVFDCHSTQSNGSEYWRTTKDGVTIIVNVQNSSVSNRNTILKVLSTFKFTK